MSELSVIFPEPVTADVAGQRVTIRPVQLRHFERFGAASGKLLDLVANATPAEVMAYAQQADSLDSILGSCTSIGRWRRRRLPAATAVELMLQVISVNSAFFDQALAQAARRLAGAGLSIH